MNHTGLTRKEATLSYLSKREGQWVPGLELMNERVGGLRAGARIYELRKEGYQIDKRPSKTSDVDEYRLSGKDSIAIEVPVPYVSWSAHRGGFKALLNGAHLQVFSSLDRTQWYWTSKGTMKDSGGPGTLDAMKKAAVLAVVSHR